MNLIFSGYRIHQSCFLFCLLNDSSRLVKIHDTHRPATSSVLYTKMNVGFISLSTDSSNLFSCRSAGKESACNVRVLGSIPGLGRYSGEGKDYSLQYSGLENSMDYMGS